jgi:hypothetical protein
MKQSIAIRNNKYGLADNLLIQQSYIQRHLLRYKIIGSRKYYNSAIEIGFPTSENDSMKRTVNKRDEGRGTMLDLYTNKNGNVVYITDITGKRIPVPTRQMGGPVRYIGFGLENLPVNPSPEMLSLISS